MPPALGKEGKINPYPSGAALFVGAAPVALWRKWGQDPETIRFRDGRKG